MERVGPNSIDKAEMRAIEKVNGTITALEIAIGRWESNGRKPEFLSAKYANYKRIHDELSDWARHAVIGRKDDFNTRLERLRELERLCRALGV